MSVVLDGFDRYLDDAEQVGQLLAAVPHLTVLATSRAPMRLTAEHVYRVQPLSAPNAAALFLARARAVLGDNAIDEDPAVVDAICARLDGLPLAIELAADRARLLPLRALLERLEDRLELLTGGARDLPTRQRSLRATLEWSWEALEEQERQLLGRLTVFEGGASLEAAEAVCAGELDGGLEALVSSLLDKSSLLRRDSGRDAQPRFEMLDTVREFAVERYAGTDDLPALDGGMRATSSATASARRSRRRARISVSGSTGLPGSAGTSAWRSSGYCRPARPTRHCGWRSRSRARCPGTPTPTRSAAGWRTRSARRRRRPWGAARGLYWDGMLALSQGLFGDAGAELEAALDAAREAGEPAVEAAVLAALGRRAVLVAAADAQALCDAAVTAARRLDDPVLLADALVTQAGACERTKAWERGRALSGEALELFRAGGDPYGAAWAFAEQGWYADGARPA
jgi:hypothetical protein